MIHSPRSPWHLWPFGPNSKFEVLEIKILPATIEKINLNFPRKQSMVPVDKGLQWVNVKQKLFG